MSSQYWLFLFIWQRCVKVLSIVVIEHHCLPLSICEYLTLLHLVNVNCLQLSEPSNKLPDAKTCQKQHIVAQLNIYNHYYSINLIPWVSWIASRFFSWGPTWFHSFDVWSWCPTCNKLHVAFVITAFNWWRICAMSTPRNKILKLCEFPYSLRFLYFPLIAWYTLIRKCYNNVHSIGTMSFLHILARTERDYNIWILSEESRNKIIHSALFSPCNPFDGNSSHPFNDFFARV